MRISDWSSDVCSSDLAVDPDRAVGEVVGVDLEADHPRPADDRVAEVAPDEPGAGEVLVGEVHPAIVAPATDTGPVDQLRVAQETGRALCGERVGLSV